MTVALAVLAALFLIVYVGMGWAVGFLLGALWSCGNIYLIKRLVERVVTPQRRPLGATIWLALIKLPLWYAVGYLIISRHEYSLFAPLAGFPLPLLVIVLKALGRMWLGIEGPGSGRKPASAGLKR
jgi:hypothetical protein